MFAPSFLTPARAEQKLRDYESSMCPPDTPLERHLLELQSSGQAQCTIVWIKGTVAYRCRTCQVNDSSAICVGCFLKGNHKEHDYVMYHSESGGCCDCGDPDAWQPKGFCSDHQNSERQEPCVPPDLLHNTRKSVQWVLLELSCLVSYIEDPRFKPPISTEDNTRMALMFLDWLQRVCSVDALRNIVCGEMMENVEVRGRPERKALQVLLRTFARMPEPIMEGETTMFLQMLYNPIFKQQYSEELVEHYQFMIESVIQKVYEQKPNSIKDFKALDSSLDRVMVQLFNVANLPLIKKKKLLKLFVDVFGNVLRSCVRRNTRTVFVGDTRIENKVYLRPQGDLRLIVAHAPVAQHLLEECPDVFDSILDVLALLQWMNPYSLQVYVDFEADNSWTLAIQLEMNTMAIIFQLVSRCYSLYIPDIEESAEASRVTLIAAARHTLIRLRKYLAETSQIEQQGRMSSPNVHVSLHIPLHRTLSAILAKLVLLPWNEEKEGFLSRLQLDYSEDEVLALMEHPLRITVWMAQIRAYQWYDNSDDFSRLELIYRGSFWHDQSMDMDVLLLQFCAVARENMEHKVFMRMAEVFELKELVCCPLIQYKKVGVNISLLQDFMRLILLVVRERRNTGMKEEDCLRYDVIQWLCVRDQTYSQLCRALSAIPVDHSKLTEMLEKVAHFHDPKVQERGFYQLRPECWEEFDPLFAHFYPNELEDAQERAIHVGRLEHFWRIRPPGGVKPPYDRLINLLHTEGCHQLLWNVLNYVSSLVTNESTATAGEALGVIALQMMGLALQDRGDFEKTSSSAEIWEQPCNDIYQNVQRKPHFTEKTNKWEWIQTNGSNSELPSILDILEKLRGVTNAPRLVDSVSYVRSLLAASPPESNLSPKSHARVSSLEEDQGRIKKQRQEAIMAQFKAKQKAFWDQVASDDEDEETLDHSREPEETGSSVTSFTAKSLSLSAKRKKVVSEPHEVQECAFCRSECGGSDKPTGYIALIQRYNMPNIVISKAKLVESINRARSIVKETCMSETETKSGFEGTQMVTYIGGKNTIDHVRTEHVRCCGHQMHQVCFQSYHASLVRSHCTQTTYEGKSIIDLQKTEFFCPICRRLANVLLPAVHQAGLSRMLQAREEEDTTLQRDNWSQFWETCKNLPSAIDAFAVQSLRVRRNFSRDIEADSFPKSPVLWEVFAGNVIHCEVETREEHKEIASSSSAPSQLSDQRTWGGDSGHWTGIRELGKLAMLSNTREADMDSKGFMIDKVIKKIEEVLERMEIFTGSEHFRRVMSSAKDVLLNMQKLVNDTYKPPQREGHVFMEGCYENLVRSDALPRTVLSMNENDITVYRENRDEDSKPLWTQPPPMPHYHNARGIVSDNGVPPAEEQGRYKEKGTIPELEADNHSRLQSDTGFHDQFYAEEQGRDKEKSMTPEPEAYISSSLQSDTGFHGQFYADEQGGNKEKVMISEADAVNYNKSQCDMEYCNQFESSHCQMEWSSSILNGSLLEADPFGLLIVLLSAFPRWPTLKDILLMVKLAYTVTIIQILLACSTLKNNDDDVAWKKDWASLVQHTSLPFLRRATLLVHIITQKDFKHEYSGPGSKVMDPTYLQQELGLKDSHRIFTSTEGTGDAIYTFNTSVEHMRQLYQNLNCIQPMLKEVPKKLQLAPLPSVYQELLLRSIGEPCTKCDSIPGEPAVCLVCGVFFCCGTECCREFNIGECSRHAESEGAGTGLFLLMRSTQLVVIRGNRVCMAPSLYLDQHGEWQEDTYLRRSQLLHLSDLRLNEVRRLWLTAGFDFDTHILHSSQYFQRQL